MGDVDFRAGGWTRNFRAFSRDVDFFAKSAPLSAIGQMRHRGVQQLPILRQ
jgi:hypothetical protein